MSFSEYFNAMSSLGQAIGNAALEPAKTRVQVAELNKATEAKAKYRDAALASPVLRDRNLAAAQIDAGQNISGDLFVTQKTGGGGGSGINNIRLANQRAKETWAQVFAMYHEEIKDPVLMEKLAPAIRAGIYEAAALAGQSSQFTTFDQAFSNLNTLAGSDILQQKQLAVKSREVGAAIQNVLIPGLKDMGYSDEDINSITNNRALLLDATRKLVIGGSTKSDIEQSLESFYSLGGEKVVKHQAEMNSAFASFDSAKLGDLSQNKGLTTQQRQMAAGLAVLKDAQEQLGSKANQSSYDLNEKFKSLSDSMNNVIRKNSLPLEERMKKYEGDYQKNKSVREKASSGSDVPAGVNKYTPPTKDQYNDLGYTDTKNEDPEIFYGDN